MKIWIDGDACPVAIKEIIFKAAKRTNTLTTIVANHFSKLPPSPYIKRQLVEGGFDAADNVIIAQVSVGDLVITADIPLADEVVKKNALALNPRGQLYTEQNIKQALAMRDFHTSLRDSGIQQSGSAKLSSSEIRQFANQLDRLLAKSHKS
ncbi:YaiI/YqxD family protein [Legionella sp. W05-934-2]|uniref:YaiI/YqxD family protein n=1 Tax=Legionella sp. W05-934-2 TaxID=1198649 RepID=UPI003461E078